MSAAVVSDGHDAKVFVTAQEIAASLRVDVRTVYRWAVEGLMPAGVKIGKVRRWRTKEISNWLASQEAGQG